MAKWLWVPCCFGTCHVVACAWGMRQEQMIILRWWLSINGLQIRMIGIEPSNEEPWLVIHAHCTHHLVLTSTVSSLHLDVESACLVLVKQIVQFVMIGSSLCQVAILPAMLVSDIWWWLLIALIVAERHGHLMHVERSVQVVKAILLQVVIERALVARNYCLVSRCSLASQSDVEIHFDLCVTAVGDGVEVGASAAVHPWDHVAWQESALV